MASKELNFCPPPRWEGEGRKWVGDYHFMWNGGCEGLAGVGVAVKREWMNVKVHMKPVDVKRVNDRIMYVKMTVGNDVLNVVSVYAPQVGREMVEKEKFYWELDKVLSGIGDKERLIVCGDFNGHVGEKVEGFAGVHGGKGYGVRNLEGEMLLKFADSKEMFVANTWFEKELSKKITYESGDCRSVIDYVLMRQSERKFVVDVKVIPGEPCILQHKLMVCRLRVGKQMKKKRSAMFSRVNAKSGSLRILY